MIRTNSTAHIGIDNVAWQPTIRAVFLRTRHISTPLLRLAMWSPWSHVAPIIGDEADSVIDATFSHGVASRSLRAVIESATAYEIKAVTCPNPQAAYAFARSQIGKPYDTLGVIGLGVRRDWQKADAWFCSEFWEAMLTAGGNQRFVNAPHRVTPQLSWMVR